MPDISFAAQFKTLTDNDPFPWQEELYKRFVSDRIDNVPPSCNLPTGLGKTSVLAIWLLALKHHPDKMPRRLVYVVNRRTVVDQTTVEAEQLRDRATDMNLAISTLRGQFADNREWSADPSRPAIICGTVDMVGSRLLFSGYGVGRNSKPLHAGFLGQDVLLVHDEAHLEPAFQKLIKAIEEEQQRERGAAIGIPKLRVMELTATSRGEGEVFGLTDSDRANPVVRERILAKKAIHLHPLKDARKLADQLADLALVHKDAKRCVIVFARTVEDVLKIRDKLAKQRKTIPLTGTMRGKERDELVENEVFKCFLPGAEPPPETVYLVCTSAGEVGVNISGDHLVCDLSTFESMAQRFGRVNRFGKCADTHIDIVHPTEFEEDAYEQCRQKTLALLQRLDGDGSPEALGNLCPKDRQEAFAPTPTILPTSDILFDAWTLTTIREPLPGRPPVEPYLHGLPTDWQLPETLVAWREEVEKITGPLRYTYHPTDLLEDYPLKPKELLREPSYRAFKHLESLAKRHPETPVWLVNTQGLVEVIMLEELADKDRKDRIEDMTVLLPPAVGGLASGMLDGASDDADDVADIENERTRVWEESVAEQFEKMRLVRRIDFPAADGDEDKAGLAWYWLQRTNEGGKSSSKAVEWKVHVSDVERECKAILGNLAHLEQELKNALDFAAHFHDHGKQRQIFQRVLNNQKYPDVMLAKSGKSGGRISETYRHEYGSLLDVQRHPAFLNLSEEMKELVLHLIAAHHGRARPYFPADEVFDPERPQQDADEMALSVPRRFARLQRKFGRWGLAYLESLLRAADWAASKSPSAFWEDKA